MRMPKSRVHTDIWTHRAIVIVHLRAVGKPQAAVQAQRRRIANRHVQHGLLHPALSDRLLQCSLHVHVYIST